MAAVTGGRCAAFDWPLSARFKDEIEITLQALHLVPAGRVS